MKFTKSENMSEPSLQGYLYADYDDLVKLLGEPHSEGDGYKTDAEWCIEFSDGTVATIYNWKNGRNYTGADVSLNSIKTWNVGGRNDRAHRLVSNLFRLRQIA